MYRTLCVMALVALCAGLAHSFSWDFVVIDDNGNQLKFIDHNNGNLTHTEKLTWNDTLYHTTYDPVHNRVLFSDRYNIYSFDIATKKTECLLKNTNYVSSLAYDPATELLFWIEDFEKIYSISIKPKLRNYFNRKDIEKHLILIWTTSFADFVTVDSCGGFIYWKETTRVRRVRFNGSESEVVFDNIDYVNSLTIDPHSQKMYFADWTGSVKSADLNGKNIRTIFRFGYLAVTRVSKDFIYCAYYHNEDKNYYTLQILKNSPRGINMKPKIFIQLINVRSMAANYNIEDVTRENQNCDTLKSLLPNNSVSTDVSQLCVHGTKVSGEPRCECAQGYSGERCDVSVCHNYCLYGDCNASAEGQPKCSCNAGYTGERCQDDVCQGYCLNDGVCSLSEESKPLCRCTGHYEGERCEFPVFLIKCSKTVSMLREILNTDVTSGKWESSCASTAA